MELSADQVRRTFQGAADLVVRPLQLGEVEATAFFLDGLTSGTQISDFVLHPLMALRPQSPESLLQQCLTGAVYAAVAQEVRDLETVCSRLLNGFCVLVIRDLPRAVAFEVKTGEKRGPSAPDKHII